MIGIVSHTDDLHTQTVTAELDRLGAPWVMIDTGRLPREVSLTTTQSAQGWSADWVDGAGVSSRDLHAMWWRRPQPFGLHDDVRSPVDRAFARGECAAAVAGLWSCLDATWVNDPDRDEAASRKMWQLRLAAELGLAVPRTCMTNDPQRAREFVATQAGGTVFKSFSATPETWRETRAVQEADLALMDAVGYAPVIFQELIEGADIRVTVVGRQVHAAQMLAAESAYPLDFRIDTAHCPTTVHVLPDQVRERLLALMSRLGLLYGAIDLRLQASGRYVFLEVNPAGQWLWVEHATGLPISASLAGLLARIDRTSVAAPDTESSSAVHPV